MNTIRKWLLVTTAIKMFNNFRLFVIFLNLSIWCEYMRNYVLKLFDRAIA